MFRLQINNELWPSNDYVIIQKLRNVFKKLTMLVESFLTPHISRILSKNIKT